ncbi:MAG: hypothetical protein K2Q01_03695 [Rickettsiales bacterium]|nr:hypothetical protein [Rickettsiales bacterium]
MKINWKIHKSILISALKELADKEYQQRIWLNTGDKPVFTLSFAEAVMNVFDDACVIDSLHEGHIILDTKVTKALWELHEATDAVNENRPEEEIINDPLMQAVREKAAECLALIQVSDGSESTVEIVE